MKKKRIYFAITGFLLWIALGWLSKESVSKADIWFQKSAMEKTQASASPHWLKQRTKEIFYLLKPTDLEVVFEEQVWIRPGDKVCLAGSEQEIGVVSQVEEDLQTQTWVVYVRMYPDHIRLVGADSTFVVLIQTADIDWIINKVLEPRMAELKKEFQEYLELHSDEIKEALSLILLDILQDSYNIMEKNLPKFMEENKEHFTVCLKRAKAEHIEEEIPVIEEVIWPLLLTESEKELKPVVNEMLEKFPKWKIAWAWVKDQVSGEEIRVKETLHVYFEEDVIPILKKHKGNFEKIPFTVLEKAWQDERLKKTTKNIIAKMIQDEELLRFLKKMMMELYKKNEQELLLHLQKKWRLEKFQEKWKNLSAKFEPYMLRMANILIREPGKNEINADIANVLRRKLFNKDRYCILMTPGTTPLRVKRFSGRYQ